MDVRVAIAADGRAVAARGEAVRLQGDGLTGRRPRYTCAGCKGPLILRCGAQVRPHFAHLKGAACSGETAEHAAAKRWVADHFASLAFASRCPRCGDASEPIRPRARGCSGILRAEIEAPYGTYRLDVGILEDAHVVGAIEVWRTHAVPSDKRRMLSAVLRHFIELRACDILELADATDGQGAPLVLTEERLCASCAALPPDADEPLAARPCVHCKQWLDKSELHGFRTTGPYFTAYVCAQCRVPCPDCHRWVAPAQLQFRRCLPCNQARRRRATLGSAEPEAGAPLFSPHFARGASPRPPLTSLAAKLAHNAPTTPPLNSG